MTDPEGAAVPDVLPQGPKPPPTPEKASSLAMSVARAIKATETPHHGLAELGGKTPEGESVKAEPGTIGVLLDGLNKKINDRQADLYDPDDPKFEPDQRDIDQVKESLKPEFFDKAILEKVFQGREDTPVLAGAHELYNIWADISSSMHDFSGDEITEISATVQRELIDSMDASPVDIRRRLEVFIGNAKREYLATTGKDEEAAEAAIPMTVSEVLNQPYKQVDALLAAVGKDQQALKFLKFRGHPVEQEDRQEAMPREMKAMLLDLKVIVGPQKAQELIAAA